MDLNAFAIFAAELADIARPLARRYFRTPVIMHSKADKSPVSCADREIEAAIRLRIREAYPDHGILGEEEGASRLDTEYVWVIDPIDGTKAFLAGKPTFGTLIALCHRGDPVIGILDQPILQERWIGVRGKGTTLNGQPVTVRACESLAKAHYSTTSPLLCPAGAMARFSQVRESAANHVFGMDCYAYGLLAAGHLDIVVECGTQAYDFCALAPIVTEAGGIIGDWQGNPLTLHSNGELLACGDARVHAETVALLQGEA